MKPDFKKRGGLVVAIVQDAKTKEVLMQAYMNELAWHRTLEVGEAVFWSTSRDELWHKGATSGNTMVVRSIRLDCDRDAVLLSVEVSGDGNACHFGKPSCFFNESKREKE